MFRSGLLLIIKGYYSVYTAVARVSNVFIYSEAQFLLTVKWQALKRCSQCKTVGQPPHVVSTLWVTMRCHAIGCDHKVPFNLNVESRGAEIRRHQVALRRPIFFGVVPNNSGIAA
jgi:hypothetical protein